ncbi:MAG: hypothetical protein Q7S02_02090, partial [bacterium]|nr:hypothetical protein [bacterium]
MSNLYRAARVRARHHGSSRAVGVMKVVLLLALAVGVFVLAVRWFRGDEAVSDETLAMSNEALGQEDSSQLTAQSSQLLLTPVDGETGGASVVRSHVDGEYALTITASLPAVDGATTAYEAWFVTPGITDFFSLGELFPREDGAWGLVWAQTDALVRSDIAQFNRVIIIREPRDGNASPSADHVL